MGDCKAADSTSQSAGGKATESKVAWAVCGCFFLEVGNSGHSSALFTDSHNPRLVGFEGISGHHPVQLSAPAGPPEQGA